MASYAQSPFATTGAQPSPGQVLATAAAAASETAYHTIGSPAQQRSRMGSLPAATIAIEQWDLPALIREVGRLKAEMARKDVKMQELCEPNLSGS